MTKGIPIYYEDALRIARSLQLAVPEFLTGFCEVTVHRVYDREEQIRIPVLYLKTVRGKCILHHQPICSIHRVKPYLCKAAPNIALLFHDRKTVETFKADCKGYGKGPYHSIADIKKSLRKEIELEQKEQILIKRGFYAGLLNPKN